jgi:CHAD domain-containing protein
VLIDGLTTHYAPNLPKKERATLDAGLIKLAKQRRTTFKKIKKTLKHDKYITFKESLQQWLEDPQYQPMAVMDIYDVLPDLLLPEVNRFFLQPGWMVGANLSAEQPMFSLEMDPQKVEQELIERGTNLHNLRKQAKRVRYQMTLFTDFLWLGLSGLFGGYENDSRCLGRNSRYGSLRGGCHRYFGTRN